MGKLILVRHGESVWNEVGRFTGWVDVPLTDKGIVQATKVGLALSSESIDVIFTSVLFRAILTALFICLQMNKHFSISLRRSLDSVINTRDDLPVYSHEALNERFYGDLQGLFKEDMRKVHGDEQVHRWRRGFYDNPPGGESLFQTCLRVVPFFMENIVPYLSTGCNVLIVAHANSLRALIVHLEQLSAEEAEMIELATGEPIHYSYSNGGFSRE
ncbi:2,3-bisphosphoglycerate-dependent phosphoglycerate mutase [Candidatus Similichlamydia epinepheli]|uniref:2,3-bisphosphoglycerate-dependent phosphoglycerate mutase n=1 Tax=Candidatus Similichlamydia epinepheli TaxID=1903953 RepID=UPI000D393251|nr:2,3-bisphosphoglycerate-dependent phosphoglycerate mutase [Candidatus Similichlamydia epinepheli]